MPPALETLHRLRRLATDQARRDLAAMLALENAAETRLAAAKTAIATEAAAATVDAGHPLAGAYAAWLPAAQARGTAAAAAVRAAGYWRTRGRRRGLSNLSPTNGRRLRGAIGCGGIRPGRTIWPGG
jgi:hypothetical protein